MSLILSMVALLIVASSLVLFWIYHKRQLERIRHEAREKREEVLRAVTSFRSLLNSEYYISKGEYADWLANWDWLRAFGHQCIKKAPTLRVVPTKEKPAPRLVYRFGCQDHAVKDFLRYRHLIKQIYRSL